MSRHLDLAKYRKLLEDEQSRVRNELESLQSMDSGSSESGETGELTDYDQHTGDAGTETFLRERDLAIEGNEQTVLRQIEIALRKIDDGTYGVCERCGELIPAARLEAIPYTPYCIKDAEWLEGR
jgi:RNA polymerase-binding transcription factor DksA